MDGDGTPTGSRSPLAGRLLVAEPALADPNFARTVVFLIEHSADGALGLVLNRPGPVEVRDAVPAWAAYVADPTVFVGGPVTPEGALCLARARPGRTFLSGDGRSVGPLQAISPTLGVVDLHGDPSELTDDVGALRVFGGYAGWHAGQVEAELMAGGWFVLDGRDDDVFTENPDHLWRAVLARQSGELRARAFFPEDPSVN